jgi:transposase
MIVIGADTHKRTHMLAAVHAETGRALGGREITASEPGHLDAVRWARGLDEDRVWALEDCRHVSRRLEQALVAAGEHVIRVAPKMMGQTRRGERTAAKSDEIDALAVARAVVKDGIEKFPTAFLDEQALEIRLLADHRDDLVAERTRVINRLRWHLLDLCPELEAQIPARALDRDVTIAKIDRKLRTFKSHPRARVAREELTHIKALTRQERALQNELKALIKAYRPALLNEVGCGTLTAAALIGRVAGAERFDTDAQFARQAGVAPIPASSGQRTRHRLHRGGDRQLNRALHVIAITRARIDPESREYIRRRTEEDGKTRREAIRCLKRHIARRIHRLLMTPTNPQPQADRIRINAPIQAACLT